MSAVSELQLSYLFLALITKTSSQAI